ncbi:MAG: amidohydrolase family protein [Alphaproteobacteria bacterium]|jgi:5-methylthioadenosine/S-adenosylhomocysteine deaminase|nr:amidohydrolase family protein [Rhodospirillaceae bacterium]MBT6205080.1 amidohydrolase family protein [Rhodospirillaceae bacterium]MBT6508809.1 amidohydrolase family protein [Rhodospirillaceae bacterium]MDG2483254.1 amidohydrolase family protein [Alphaproteobacteria bacterium]
MSVLITNATLITVDDDDRVIEDGAIAIDDGRITDLGATPEVLVRNPAPGRTIDGAGRVVAPGFISTHTHVGYTIFRGRAEDHGLNCVVGMYIPMNTVLQREERCAVGSLTYGELLRSGVTTVLEMEEDADVYAPFVERLGIRSAMGIMTSDADADAFTRGEYVFDPKVTEAEVKHAVEFAETWHGRADGRITVMMAPNMTINVSPELLRASRREADRLGLRLTSHCGWGEEEYDIVSELHGVSPFEYLRDNGLLAPDTVIAHGYVTDEHNTDVFAHSGACLAHCPLMNATRGQIAPLLDYQKRGIPVSLGIDNMYGDYFEVVRAAVLMARIKSADATAILAADALRLATMGGARALGMEDEIGSLEIGKRADLMMVDYGTFGLRPTLDPVQNLVYHAHASNVELVMVDGRIVVEEHGLVHADGRELAASAESNAQEAWGRFVAKYGGIAAR